MSSVVEIEQAIAHLPAPDFLVLGQWFDEWRNQRWDEQMEKDAESGALDFLIVELDEHLASGEVRPLDEVLHNS